MNKKAIATREKLIQAANQVLLEAGIIQLTLESVAATAGVSKGGLLYHFPSKDSLIEAMIAYYLDHFEAHVDQLMASEKDTGTRSWFRAFVRATFEADPRENAISAGLLAAIAVNPKLLRPMRERYAVWQARLEDGTVDPLMATLLRLTMDGLWVSDLLGFSPPGDVRRTELQERVMELVNSLS